MSGKSKRIYILGDDEVQHLYELPKLSLDEKDIFFTLNNAEMKVVGEMNAVATKIHFVLQYGYFKIKQRLFEYNYDSVRDDLEYINTTMRSIRRIQVDCTLLDLCANNIDIMEKEYDGYLFDKILRTDGLFQFMVFLPELKLSSRITLRDNIDNYENKKFKLFLFNDEENFKKKIRLHLL